ncbi:putative bicyclomycin resistance protein [Diaporthe sp. PMI_573]|nr:putative bicyclomycin resistance protein [Diaporthaceae sp. PMI_573]
MAAKSNRSSTTRTDIPASPPPTPEVPKSNTRKLENEKIPSSDGANRQSQEVKTESDRRPPSANDDLNVIGWNGDDDPEHPFNWPSWQIVLNCIMINLASFIAPLGSTIFAPAVPQVVREFNVHSSELAAFVVSVDVLGFAFGPLLMAPLSEVYGRVKIYHVCDAGFIVSTILCGAAPNMPSLIVFRLCSGIFGALFSTIGGGCIADMVRQEKRAGVMALCGFGNLLGPIVGPIMGGFINASWGWRWTQYVVAIAAGVPAILMIFTFRESYHPVLLERRAAKLRKETGNMSLKSKYDSGLAPADLLKRSIIRPSKLLVCQPIVTIAALFIGISYAILFVMFTSITSVFDEYYHFSASSAGLAFVGLGVGSVVGVLIYAIAANRYIKRKKLAPSAAVSTSEESNGLEGGSGSSQTPSQGIKPEDRLFLLPVGSVMLPAGLLIYGWTIQYHIHWIVPIMATALIAAGNVIIYMSFQVFLVDSFTVYAASALAAMIVVRSLAAGLLPLSGLALYDTLGVGWGNTLLAFLNMLFIPVAWLIKKYGAYLLERYKIENL